MASEIESRGLIFELQWKKKPGLPNKEEDIASLGIWDTADPSLDWCTFKSYLSQNLGTPEDISVAYVDSEGDELPIESECEFQEALKFARERSRKGRKIILKVDKQESPDQPTITKTDKKRSLKYKHARGIKLTDRFSHSFDFIQPKLVGLPDKSSVKEDNIKSIKQVLTKDLEDLQKYNKILMEKLEKMSKLEEDRRKMGEEHHKKYKSDKDDLPPPWFKKYIQKMKHEIVTEVTANTRQLIGSMMANNYRSGEKNGGGYVATKVKKRSSDEESSDAALGSDQRDHKLLRKIEKLHKREKKLEKKLDSKLEKLENKTKRMMEKKSQSKPLLERERVPEKKTTRKRSSDGPVGTYLMDAILLNDGPKAETHIKLGKRFTKIWEIMNNGTLPWTDKTELRLAWGTLGLEPEEPSVKCPILEPGEKGQIAVNFRAPDFSGTFESYWHFYHMGERFGHWIGCAVVVEEPTKCEKPNVGSSDSKLSSVLKKTKVKCDKLGEGKLETLDNIASSTKEFPPSEVKRFNDATNSHHVHNIEVETNKKGDIVADLSMKSKSEQISNLLCNLPNNNNINESPDQQKSNLISDIKVLHRRGPEYDSDSDDDNLSIISGTGLSSESDDDENFVVVPMPACFVHDVPLDSASVPIIVKDNSGKVIMTLDNSSGVSAESRLASKPNQEDQKVPACSLTDKPTQVENIPVGTNDPPKEKKYPFGSFEVTTDKVGNSCTNTSSTGTTTTPGGTPFFCFSANSTNKANTDVEEQSVSGTQQTEMKSENTDSPEEAEASYSSTTSFETTEKWWDSEDFKSEVYAVDSQGSCVPLANAWPANESTRIPLGFEAKPSTPKRDRHEKKHKQSHGASKFKATTNIPSSSTSSRTFTTSGPDATFSHTYSFSQSRTTSAGKHKTPVTSVFNFTTPPVTRDVPVNVTTDTSRSNTDTANSLQSPIETAVHILPETIVNGAINVASSAYSTARAVLSNLRVKPPHGEVLDGRCIGPRSTNENLRLLSEMGFFNTTHNVLLLQRFNNDIGKVVAELLNAPSQ